MARKSKSQTPKPENQEANKEKKDLELQTTFNTDPIDVLVEDGEIENAV